MKKTWKRFISLAIVFASIISFLPMQIGSNGKEAKAITTQIEVSGTATQSGDNIVITNGEYSTQEPYTNFTLSLEYKIVDDIKDIKIGETGVTAQEVIIKSIDGIKLDGADLDNNNTKLKEDIGCSISEGTTVFTDDNGKQRIGVTISGLPFGVNKIEYQIKETTRYNKGKLVPTLQDPKHQEDDLQGEKDTYVPSLATTKEIVIQHANEFVQRKIDPMTFNSYIGNMADYEANKDFKSNKNPFLFTENAEYNNKCPLRYNFNVSDAVSTLQYIMNFEDTVPIDNGTKVFKNGIRDLNITIDSKKISGYLQDLGSSDSIVVKLNDNGTNVSKAYAIQLQYTTLGTDKDYTLRDAGIKKLNYTDDNSVEAYIGKHFITTKENGVFIYTGEITIDKKAEMKSMQPTIGRTSSMTAYKISNHYKNTTLVENSKIINGKPIPYVDFDMDTINQIWLEVYEGTDGNIKQGTSPFAIYKLNVKFVEGSVSSTVDFSVDNPAFLTQPGRILKNEEIPFSANRRTYNLNFVNDTNDVTINLNKPITHEKNDSNKPIREYIKVWSGASTQSDNVTELTDLTQTKSTKVSVNVNIEAYKKIIVQAYYDQVVYVKDSNGVEKEESRTPYPIGEKYTFYIAKNPDKVDPVVTQSTDASLSNIKASNGTVKSIDGTSGFSSDKTNYEVNVPKIDTSSAITVTATNSKVKDITATVSDTGDEYGLFSGEPFDISLSTTGKTDIKIVVTAEDGVTTKTYNLSINNDTRSASALLKNVITDNGDFTFDPEKNPNKIRVDQVINKLKVSPVAQDANSRITINGTKYAGSPITIELKGSQKTDMTITVTSEDGSDSKTYNFEIYRTDSPIANTEDDDKEDIFYDEIDGTWIDLSKYEEWGMADGKAAYFDKKGRQVKDRWISTKGVWYYLDSKGYKASGWRKEVGGKSYYLDSTTGAVKTGWLNQDNKIYYLGLNGVMQKGWLNLNGHWYYFTPEGQMVINQSMYIDDGVYNFGTDGAMY